jgi:uncharacterized protein (DUF58 family)
MTRLLYRVYRLASALRYHVPRRWTPAGLLMLAGLVLAGTASFDMERSVAYQAFALQFCLLFTAWILKRFFRGKFQIARHLPRFASVGHPFRYRVEIRNQSKKEFRDLELFEDLTDPRPTFEEFALAPAPAEAPRSFRVFSPRAAARTRDFRRAIIPPARVPPLRAGASVTTDIEVHPLRRGVLRFTGASVARPDPLGLARGFRRVAAPASVLVLPRRYPVPPIVLGGGRKYQPGGVALAAAVGESEEFISLRDYRPGDPLRHMHWRSLARLGRPIVREYQDEFIPRHALILDTFARADQAEAFEEAVSVAASFACTVDTQESLLDLLFVGAQAVRVTTGRGLGQAAQALEVLAAVQRQPEGSFVSLQHLVEQYASLVCGCIVVLLAWDEPRRELVRRLRILGLPVLTLIVGTRPTGGAAARSTVGPSSPGAETNVHYLEPGRIAEGLLRLEGVS